MANKSRPKQLSFRVSEEEWELLQQKIAESGMNQQQYILSCVFGKAIINTDGIMAVVPELKQQGANLNQIGQKLSVTLNDLSSVWQSLGAALQTVRGTKKIMKLFYMILASLITVLMASYALWLIAHIDMPLPKRLVQLFPPLFLLIMVFLRIFWLFIR